MARIGFVGIGRMGDPMVRNLLKAGHQVTAYDIVPSLLEGVVAAGARAAGSGVEAATGAECVITMLPASKHVREAWLGADGRGGMAAATDPGALLIDCSTIDVVTAREVAAASGRAMLDAPVSGGTMGAEAGTLTFMVGGPADAFARAQDVLGAMGRKIVHCGEAGAGQGIKLCNNMMLAATMAATCEGLILAERLGLTHQALYDVVSTSTGRSWALNEYCPVPGPVPTSPANRDYKPGFSAALMLKDLGLAQDTARAAGVVTPAGALARDLYARFVEQGGGELDFSGIIRMLREG